MKKLENYEQILNKIKEEKYFLLYVSMNNCSICQIDMPKVEKIFNEQNFTAYYIEGSEIPEAVGQLSLFSVPVVILFYEGKEIHRQAKIIDFEELNYRMEQICENVINKITI
ncbi:thioredoxin family protein [Leptotrichia sp. HSP-334]|uniref:Thioredoxin family protein n=1 Tax=Leptotrichia rugosa TaxID=3239302 RepID=A0AB39VH05_9FUSO